MMDWKDIKEKKLVALNNNLYIKSAMGKLYDLMLGFRKSDLLNSEVNKKGNVEDAALPQTRYGVQVALQR
jgi:hypothetical protein